MNKIVKLALILFAFSAIMAACLGGINLLTADRIAAINAEKLAAAMEQVLPADAYNEVEYKGNDTRIQNVYEAAGAGHTVKVAIGGSQGTIELIVGVDDKGAVSGISIVSHAETPGLGAVAAQANDKGQAFRDQFVGQTGTVAVTKDGGQIEALSGATVSSRAICAAATAALEAVKSVG